MAEARIDKWMWASRIFKTRTIAAEACKKGRVSINGSQVKPARTVKPGDVIEVRKPPITYSFKVLQAIEKRVGAKLIPEILENVTSPEQYELLEMSKISGLSIAPVAPDVLQRKTDAVWMSLSHRNICRTMMTLISILTLKRNRY